MGFDRATFPRRTEELNNDVLSTALSDPSGNLASVLLKRTPRPKGQIELGKQLRIRYEKLIGSGDLFALLARVRLSAAIAFLFERAPKWTTTNLLPSFNWDSSDAPAMWSARKYSNQIGSAELFRLIKKPFSELFSRADVPEEDLRVFSDWLAVRRRCFPGRRHRPIGADRRWLRLPRAVPDRADP